MATPDELAPYRIRSLESLQSGESEGSGSYGAVYRVKVSGFPCIAKRLHDILVGRMTGVQVSEREKASVQARFREECILLSKLRHPNIVQFIGVHYGRTRDDLTLVMECLYTDLDKCLEKCVKEKRTLPLPLQLSILLDVAYGLLYLHSQKPPIVHRDLKAGNVLLTQHMRAKLADLGVSKILDLHPLSHMTRTVCPGTPAVMPPEALVKIPLYDTKLDDFSYGTLILHVTNHEFPMSYEITFANKGQVQIAKRNDSIEKMGRQHCLYDLVIHCLQDDPKERPATAEICATVECLVKKYPQQFKDVLEMYTEIERVQEDAGRLQQRMEELQSTVTEQRVEELQSTVTVQRRELERLQRENDGLRDEVAMEKAKSQTFEEDFKQERQDREQAHNKMVETEQMYAHQLNTMGTELQKTQQELTRHKEVLRDTEILLHGQTQQLQQHLHTKEQEVARLQEEVLAKTLEVEQYKKQADQYREELEAHKQHVLIQKETRDQLELETMRQKCDAWREEVERLAPLRMEADHLRAQVMELEGRIDQFTQENEGLGKQLQDVLDESERKQNEMAGKVADYDQQMNQREWVTELQQIQANTAALLTENAQLRERSQPENYAKLREELHASLAHQFEQLQKALQEQAALVQRKDDTNAQLQQQLTEASNQEQLQSVEQYRYECDQARMQNEELLTDSRSSHRLDRKPLPTFEGARKSLLFDRPGSSFDESGPFPANVKTREGVVQIYIQRPQTMPNAKQKPPVVVKRIEPGEYERGTLMFTGKIPGIKEVMAGVQLEIPRPSGTGTGLYDGTYKDGKMYFECTPGYGLYTPLSRVYVEANEIEGKPKSLDQTTSGVASPPSHVSTTSIQLQHPGNSDRDHGATDLSSQQHTTVQEENERTTESDEGDRGLAVVGRCVCM